MNEEEINELERTIEAERSARVGMLRDVIEEVERRAKKVLEEIHKHYEEEIMKLYKIDRDILKEKKIRARRR